MSEVTFAKSFLATLDKRPIKLAADFASDPRKYPNQSPYILPRQTHPYPRSEGPTSTQHAQSQTITATLKPMRGGESVALPDVTLDSTIHDIKAQYSQRSGHAQDKIKLLLNKKPAADLKTLKDLGVENNVEISVMIMGGGVASPAAATTPAVEKSDAVAAAVASPTPEKMDVDPPPSGPESEKAHVEAEKTSKITTDSSATQILKTDDFWADLQAFLAQRLRDENESRNLAAVFKDAWEKR